jgi:guanine deaminase
MVFLVSACVHYPQSAMIASYGAQLLDWLNTYTFPEEARLADYSYAQKTASFLLQHCTGEADLHLCSAACWCQSQGCTFI